MKITVHYCVQIKGMSLIALPPDGEAGSTAS